MTPRTSIRLMWDHGIGVVTADYPISRHPQQVLVVPYNPACRLKMIKRTVATLYPKARGEARERLEAQVMAILGTALTPNRRKR